MYKPTILCLCLLASIACLGSAFVNPTSARSVRASSTQRSMVFGPKQALAIEKRKNPKQFEATIQGLMKTKKLTRDQAEKRYGEFLLDPDGFALRAAEADRKKKGYKNWIEQAVAESDDPEATRQRIEDYTNKNRLKGTAIMVLFSAVALGLSATGPPTL